MPRHPIRSLAALALVSAASTSCGTTQADWRSTARSGALDWSYASSRSGQYRIALARPSVIDPGLPFDIQLFLARTATEYDPVLKSKIRVQAHSQNGVVLPELYDAKSRGHGRYQIEDVILPSAGEWGLQVRFTDLDVVDTIAAVVLVN